MRNDVYETLLMAMDENIDPSFDPSFPPIFPFPKKKIQIRLISRPLTYFVSPDSRAIRPAVPKFVEWHTTYDVKGLQPPDGFLKLDDYQIHKYDDGPSRMGICWGDMLPPPKNGVLQRFRIACFDRVDKGLKWLDFGVELFDQFCEWSDNFNAPPGGPNGPDWVIKVERPHEGPYARIRALFLDKTPFTETELALIRGFDLKDRLIESVKQSSCTCCHGCHCELHGVSLPTPASDKPKQTLDEIIDDAKVKLTNVIAQCQKPADYVSGTPIKQDTPPNPYTHPLSAFEAPFQREYQRKVCISISHMPGVVACEPGAGKTKIDWLSVPSLKCPVHADTNPSALMSADGTMWKCMACQSAGPVKDGVAVASDDPKIQTEQEHEESDSNAQLAEARDTLKGLQRGVTDVHMWNANIHATPKSQKLKIKLMVVDDPKYTKINSEAKMQLNELPNVDVEIFGIPRSCADYVPVPFIKVEDIDKVVESFFGQEGLDHLLAKLAPKSIITATQTPREPKSFSKEEFQKSLEIVEASNTVLSFKMEGDLDKWQYASLVCAFQEPFRRCADAPEEMQRCGCHANWAIETFDRAIQEEAEEREPYVVYACKKHLSEMLNPEIRYSIIPIPQRKPDAPTQSQTDQGF